MVGSKCAGLQLAYRKCKAVPLWFGGGEIDFDMASRVLAEADSNWSRWQVCTSLEYLGFFLGPGASGRDQWDSPWSHYLNSVRSIASSGADSAAELLEYSSRALGRLSYNMQLIDPTSEMENAERHELNIIVRASGCWLTVRWWEKLEPFTGTTHCDFRSLALAGQLRASHKFAWSEWGSLLGQACEGHVSTRQVLLRTRPEW